MMLEEIVLHRHLNLFRLDEFKIFVFPLFRIEKTHIPYFNDKNLAYSSKVKEVSYENM